VRLLLLVLGAGLGFGQSVIAWERGAAPTEALAPALFIVVFAGAIFVGVSGGLAGAAIASVLYGLVLVDQSSALGIRLFLGLLISRVATYFFYGLMVAVGTRFIESRLYKLELYDQIDDETKLYNASFFLHDAELETSRATRYQSLFSVAELRIARGELEASGGRRYRRARRDFARIVARAIRTVDRAARVDIGEDELFLVMLPETGKSGSSLLATRLEASVRELLTERGLAVNGALTSRALSYPDDSEALEELRQNVAAADEKRRVVPIGGGAAQ